MTINVAERLIGDIDAFFHTYYGKAPTVLRADDAESIRNLLPLVEVDELLASPVLRPPYLEISRRAQTVRERTWARSLENRFLRILDSVDTDAVATEFSKGATLVLNDLDDYHPRVKALCDGFHSLFRTQTKAVVFITPPNHQGLGLHFDNFEGFIIQTHGEKRWYVYEQMLPLSVQSKGLRLSEVAEPVVATRLEVGDCLYIPWGSPHYAESESSLSCHITVMSIPWSWPGVMRQLLKQAIPPEAYDVVAGLGYHQSDSLHREARRYLEQTIERAQQTDVAAFLKERIIDDLPRRPARGGFLEQYMRRRALTPDSKVTRNRNVGYVVRPVDGRLELRVGAKRIRLPREAGKALSGLDLARATAVREIVSPLPEAAMIRLVSHLAATGVLRIDE